MTTLLEKFRIGIGAAICFICITANADLQRDISDLQHRWAAINYQSAENEQAAAFENLTNAAEQVAVTYGGRAEPLIWQAIILSSAAKAQGGLSALSKVKRARDLLLRAEKIEPTALNGSIYCSLGSLYAKVPGWPIAYGDKKKAEAYFKTALEIAPDSIDTNFLYADLLADEGNYIEAALHLKKALAAPARPDRADADAGRRKEAQRLLDNLKQKYGEKLADN